ncbi:MAG: lysophospholipid acyltransferase family protein [Methylophilaceae bacterium]
MLKTNTLTRAYRITRVFLHTLIGLIIAAFLWPFLNSIKKNRVTKWWCKALLKCFHIQIIVHGDVPNSNIRSTMFVANHISWVDIHAINSVIPLRFIAKSEVSSWPVFGYLVRKSGTLFIDRSKRKDAARIVVLAKQSLQNGDNVGFFPEGTTSEGVSILPFKSSIVQAAIDAEATICPIALRYPQPDKSANTQMAYAGETTMGESMLNILKQKNPVVELHFLAPMPALHANRHGLTEAAFIAISKQLNL